MCWPTGPRAGRDRGQRACPQGGGRGAPAARARCARGAARARGARFAAPPARAAGQIMRPSAAHMEPGAGVTARDMRTRSARPARGPQNTGELLKATPPVRARMGGARWGRDSRGRDLLRAGLSEAPPSPPGRPATLS